MYNPHQTRHGRRIANSITFGLAILLFLMYACAGCVSAKKYNQLKSDYQQIGSQLHNAEHGAKLYEVEKQHTKIIMERIKRDSLKYGTDKK
jgi:outer membrane murein-binding lipoprotein Lpp